MKTTITAATIALATVASPVLAGSVGLAPSAYNTDISDRSAIVVVEDTDGARVTNGTFAGGLHAVNDTAVRILTELANENGRGTVD